MSEETFPQPLSALLGARLQQYHGIIEETAKRSIRAISRAYASGNLDVITAAELGVQELREATERLEGMLQAGIGPETAARKKGPRPFLTVDAYKRERAAGREDDEILMLYRVRTKKSFGGIKGTYSRWTDNQTI